MGMYWLDVRYFVYWAMSEDQLASEAASECIVSSKS
jgi:hypothetical protein